MEPVDRVLFGDAPIRWLQALLGTDHPAPLEMVTLLGDTWGVLLAVAIGAWVYGRVAGYAVAAATAVATPFWLGLASLISADRPSGTGVVVFEQLEAGGFPSGHVFHAVVAWGALSGVTRLPRWVPLAVGVAVAISRVYLGVHFLGDVLASLLLGPLFAWGAVRVWTRARRRWGSAEPRVRQLLLTIAAAAALALFLGPVEPDRLRRWEVAGIAVVGPLAVAARLGWQADAAGGRAPPTTGIAVWGGLAGLVALAAASRLAGPAWPWIGAVATGAAMLWIFLGVPSAARRPRYRS